MDETRSQGELLATLARILIRCFLLGIAVVMYWAGMVVFAGDFVYNMHSSLFPMSSQQFYSIHYAGIAFTKVCIFLFFLLPYISIRLVQRKNRNSS